MPTQRFKICKVGQFWTVQQYGSNTRSTHAWFFLALLVGTGRIKPLPQQLDVAPVILQEPDTCTECGRRVVYEERPAPGGGGWFKESCTYCDYEYSDGF